MLYNAYLQLDKVLDAQRMVSAEDGRAVHDEHLFIITHQAYELWFKQIIFELDSIRKLFDNEDLAETQTLELLKRLNRIVLILKFFTRFTTSQIIFYPVGGPGDDLRDDDTSRLHGFPRLSVSSFRFPEFAVSSTGEQARGQTGKFTVDSSSTECNITRTTRACLGTMMQPWRCCELPRRNPRSPSWWNAGWNAPLDSNLRDSIFGENTSIRYSNCSISSVAREANECDAAARAFYLQDHDKRKQIFDSIFQPGIHEALIRRGERRFSHRALQGAIMITFYRDEPRFSQPHQLLMLLMDIDSLITKWRYNHVIMVQRMIGSQNLGTGGSSGYQYLRATLSDRYKVFIDLFNLSTFLIPRSYIPPLSRDMKTRLSSVCNLGDLTLEDDLAADESLVADSDENDQELHRQVKFSV
ncbi:hypothetical protein B566_EDAN001896 [Ephemera danica]|nr:hypothetical protein B566_EDAN001896 [Ephemera danica]